MRPLLQICIRLIFLASMAYSSTASRHGHGSITGIPNALSNISKLKLKSKSTIPMSVSIIGDLITNNGQQLSQRVDRCPRQGGDVTEADAFTKQ